jgi:hypothetical protein
VFAVIGTYGNTSKGFAVLVSWWVLLFSVIFWFFGELLATTCTAFVAVSLVDLVRRRRILSVFLSGFLFFRCAGFLMFAWVFILAIGSIREGFAAFAS